ncbi:phospholipase-like protein [Tanacetum coccineum]|uniref:Phospholipase-like protein n=1 Tax=Tanacetum coccineum TaxID=301880 RepID=A0ABQ5JDL3_9ASTR
MTMTTIKYLIATRSPNSAPSTVVRTSVKEPENIGILVYQLYDKGDSDGTVGYSFSSCEVEESDGDVLPNPISDVDIPTSSEQFRTPDDALTASAQAILSRSQRKSSVTVVNDGHILRNHVHRILKKHVHEKVYYVHLVDLFNETQTPPPTITPTPIITSTPITTSTPIPTQPATSVHPSQPQNQRVRKRTRRDTEVTQPSEPEMVLKLEKTKSSHQIRIESLERKVKKLEKGKKTRTHKLKRLYKVGLSARVISLEGEAVVDITLVDEVKGKKDDMMVDVDELTGKEVVVEVEVAKDVNLNEDEQKTMDKGKGKMDEQEKHLKVKDQISFDEQEARMLQAQFDEEARVAEKEAQRQQEANLALIKEWNNVQAKIDADYQLMLVEITPDEEEVDVDAIPLPQNPSHLLLMKVTTAEELQLLQGIRVLQDKAVEKNTAGYDMGYHGYSLTLVPDEVDKGQPKPRFINVPWPVVDQPRLLSEIGTDQGSSTRRRPDPIKVPRPVIDQTRSRFLARRNDLTKVSSTRGMWDRRVNIGHTSNANSGNVINEVDIENLTIEQYLMLTQGNLVQGMVKNEFGGMMKKDIEDMTIAKYIEYEADIKRQPWKNARLYYPTNRDTNSLSHDRTTVEQKVSTNEELSPDEDFDVWLNAEMEKRMCGQDKENEEDALIDILKTLVGECKSVYTNRNTRLPPNEIHPGSFTLPCTIDNLNLYAMADLGASVNVMPKLTFKHLKLASLKETSMVVEMANIKKKAPLGIVENILVRYRNKVIDDTTRERRYYQWVAENSEFNDSSIIQEATVDSFDVEIDFGKTLNDPYSRRFDEYKENFDSEIEQLANEYDLRDTECQWHDEGFEEEEEWESGIEKTCYTPPFVKSETFEVK